jgi:hypothetical protein
VTYRERLDLKKASVRLESIERPGPASRLSKLVD